MILHHGDALLKLQGLESESIDLIITSPPYYGLRNYGVDGQIGHEKTPQEYIDKLIEIFAECKRVLKKTGSIWVNIGDTYGTISGGAQDYLKGNKKIYGKIPYHDGIIVDQDVKKALVQKSLIGIPERFCIAMTDRLGLIRRNTIIWHKPNCMPSSAKDRFTIDFEYFYFFTKTQRYYFNTQYEKTLSGPNNCGWYRSGRGRVYNSDTNHNFDNGTRRDIQPSDKRLKRCVWTITTTPLKEAHFATFPEKLIETPIKACCPPVDGIVLDPFAGAGTTLLVAKKLGRRYIGIELNEEYIKIANKRLMSILP